MDFTIAQFSPLVGSQFTVQTQHGAVALQLSTATEMPRKGLPEAFRTPLSLIFDGPDNIVLQQDNYHIEHPALGPQLWSIVPVMSSKSGPGVSPMIPQYQVLFA